MNINNESKSKGLHHLGLTVSNLDETLNFFTKVLGFSKVGEKPDYPAVFISDDTVMLTLWQAKTAQPIAFNRHENIGLHHFALSVPTVDALHEIYREANVYPGVEIEFSPEDLTGMPAKHMMCLIPGGIRMELIALLP